MDAGGSRERGSPLGGPLLSRSSSYFCFSRKISYTLPLEIDTT